MSMLTGRLIALRHPTECVRALDSLGVRQSTAGSHETLIYRPTQTIWTRSILDGTISYGWVPHRQVLDPLRKPEPPPRAGPHPARRHPDATGARELRAKAAGVGLALAAITAAHKAASLDSPRDSAGGRAGRAARHHRAAPRASATEGKCRIKYDNSWHADRFEYGLSPLVTRAWRKRNRRTSRRLGWGYYGHICRSDARKGRSSPTMCEVVRRKSRERAFGRGGPACGTGSWDAPGLWCRAHHGLQAGVNR